MSSLDRLALGVAGLGGSTFAAASVVFSLGLVPLTAYACTAGAGLALYAGALLAGGGRRLRP